METVTLPIFNLDMPTALPGVNPDILNPRTTYASVEQWQEKAQDLAERFITNFDKYTDTPAGAALIIAGPKLQSAKFTPSAKVSNSRPFLFSLIAFYPARRDNIAMKSLLAKEV